MLPAVENGQRQIFMMPKVWKTFRLCDRAVCSGVLETFNSATDYIISDNWKFTLFNYVSERIGVIIHVPKEHVRDQMY